MKRYFLLIGALIFLSCSCLKKSDIAKQDIADDTQQVVNTQKDHMVEGIVSHEFLAKGCTTIIKITNNSKVLIPHQTLPKEFDIDKLVVLFTYATSKRMQTAGCDGVPITIKTIEKK